MNKQDRIYSITFEPCPHNVLRPIATDITDWYYTMDDVRPDDIDEHFDTDSYGHSSVDDKIYWKEIAIEASQLSKSIDIDKLYNSIIEAIKKISS